MILSRIRITLRRAVLLRLLENKTLTNALIIKNTGANMTEKNLTMAEKADMTEAEPDKRKYLIKKEAVREDPDSLFCFYLSISLKRASISWNTSIIKGSNISPALSITILAASSEVKGFL